MTIVACPFCRATLGFHVNPRERRLYCKACGRELPSNSPGLTCLDRFPAEMPRSISTEEALEGAHYG